jgi:hypothetical protein
MRLRSWSSALLFLALGPGCDCGHDIVYKKATYAGEGGASGSPARGGNGGGGRAGGGQGGVAGGAGNAGSAGSGGKIVDADGCVEAAKLVYVLSNDGDLYRFDPPALTFTKVAAIDCATSASPYSMAVSRSGTAYAVFSDGSLHSFDVTDGVCVDTPYVTGQQGFGTFGMGFVSKDALDETLFVADSAGGRLARIDTKTFGLSLVGSFDKLTTQRSELTGNGAGELYGAFEGVPFQVARIDPQSAAILSVAPQPEATADGGKSAFAFASYGGQFWLFVGTPGETKVFAYDPALGTTVLRTTTTFAVIGAGVSTCAPRTTVK